jgi:predicted dehydrogenase
MSPLPRRRFLQSASLVGSALAFPAVLRAAAPNRRVQIAAIGLTGQGYTDIQNLSRHKEVKFVGFCDIDQAHFAKVDAEFPGVPHFADFREMLDRLGDGVDAVCVAIPDHMHALASIEAMRRGKHVYCEKPLAHTVWECRQMAKWAERTKVITQMGNHAHSSVEYRLATRLIHEGAIGQVKEVVSWLPYTGNERTRRLEPPPPAPVPVGLDWERWLGGAPFRPYATGVYHPFAWRDWQDFGGGAALGDFGCHLLDPVFTCLDLQAPLSVTADNSGIGRQVWPTMQTITYVFPGNTRIAGPTLKVTWMDGGQQPDRKLARLPAGAELPKMGSLFIGEKGNMVLPHVGGPRFYPAEDFAGFAYPKDIRGMNHQQRWVDAIIANQPTTDSFAYAARLTETVQLGNVATRVCEPPVPRRGANVANARDVNRLDWDSAAFRITNHPAAHALLTKPYRPGWEVPAA